MLEEVVDRPNLGQKRPLQIKAFSNLHKVLIIIIKKVFLRISARFFLHRDAETSTPVRAGVIY